MKESLEYAIAAAIGTAAGIGIVFYAAVRIINIPEPVVEVPRPLLVVHREFVCYSDGKLAERHVGVKTARSEKPNLWHVSYVDGGHIIYIQSAGESCGVEKYHDDLAP